MRDAGYEFSKHEVITEDGYILGVHRVSNPQFLKNAPVVFMQHGLFGSSDAWTTNGENSPAFMFAKAGFDVWLGNNRGNDHSRKHVTLDANKDEKSFFDFSFIELGKYDIPA